MSDDLKGLRTVDVDPVRDAIAQRLISHIEPGNVEALHQATDAMVELLSSQPQLTDEEREGVLAAMRTASGGNLAGNSTTARAYRKLAGGTDG